MSSPEPTSRPSPLALILAFIVRLVFVLLLWWVLTEGDFYRWWFGVLVAAAAAGASMHLLPPAGTRVRVIPILQFVPFFLWHSVLGGIDVARRVVLRNMQLEPAFIEHPLELKPGPARLWLVAMLSLMPGTLSCHLEEDTLEIHALDRSMEVDHVVRELERRIARIFSDSTDEPPAETH